MNLQTELRRAHDTVAALLERAADGRTADGALEALSTAMEELEVSAQELRAQNDELASTREALERQRARYLDLFDGAPDAYLITSVDGVVRQANRRATELLGTAREGLVGKPIVVFVDPRVRSDVRTTLHRIADGMELHAWELTLLGADGRVDVAASVTCGTDETGDDELRWLFSDTHDSAPARRELAAMLDTAQHDASSLRVVTRWQSSVLHAATRRLEDPLRETATVLTTLLTRKGDLAPARERELLDQARRLTSGLQRLLPKLDGLSRLRVGSGVAQRRRVSVVDLVERVCRTVGLAPERLVLELAVDEVWGDELLLELALEHLLGNAIRHAPERSAVTVRTEAHAVDVRFSVLDGGPGVPPELREDVFSPFMQATTPDHPQAGAGLGLTVVEMVAAMHGGSAWIDESPTGGAAVHLQLSDAHPDARNVA